MLKFNSIISYQYNSRILSRQAELKLNAALELESKLLAYFCCSVVYFWAIVSVCCAVSVCSMCVWCVCVCKRSAQCGWFGFCVRLLSNWIVIDTFLHRQCVYDLCVLECVCVCVCLSVCACFSAWHFIFTAALGTLDQSRAPHSSSCLPSFQARPWLRSQSVVSLILCIRNVCGVFRAHKKFYCIHLGSCTATVCARPCAGLWALCPSSRLPSYLHFLI